MRLLLLLVVPISSGCSIVQFDRFGSFGDWFVGSPGFNKTFSDAYNYPSPSDLIMEERPAIYGHFRLFEVIFQPVGGWQYPQRKTASDHVKRHFTDEEVDVEDVRRTTRMRERGDATYALSFNTMEAGLLELVPYRLFNSNATTAEKVVGAVVQPGVIIIQVALDFVRLPVYAVHDVAKTFMIPVAAIHYAGK